MRICPVGKKQVFGLKLPTNWQTGDIYMYNIKHNFVDPKCKTL